MRISYLTKVAEFVKSLNSDLKDKVITLVDVLEERNGVLGMPDSRSLGKGLFELRLLGAINVRIFYCLHKNTAYLLHAIIKKSQKISKKDIDYARKMKKAVEQL